jgi:hypothetical protein
MNNGERNIKCFWKVEKGRCVRLKNSPPSVSRLFRQRWILTISKSYRHSRLLRGINLLFYMLMMFVPHRKHKPPQHVTEIGLLFYMLMMFVPHRKHNPPQHVTEISLFFYMLMMFVPHWKHKPPQHVTMIALLFLLWHSSFTIYSFENEYIYIYIYIYISRLFSPKKLNQCNIYVRYFVL